jgi:hypothetical protein
VPADDYYVWITGEGKVVKNLSARFETEAFDLNGCVRQPTGISVKRQINNN